MCFKISSWGASLYLSVMDDWKLGRDIEQERTWLPAEKQPKASLARQVEARWWRVQHDVLWRRFDLEATGAWHDSEQDNYLMKQYSQSIHLACVSRMESHEEGLASGSEPGAVVTIQA